MVWKTEGVQELRALPSAVASIRAWKDKDDKAKLPDKRSTAFPPWDRMTGRLRGLCYQRSLYRLRTLMGPDYVIGSFTVNFTPDVITKAQGPGESFLETIHERIARQLKVRAKNEVEYWFAIETRTKTKTLERPHVHGTFMAHRDDVKVIEPALKAASRIGRTKPLHKAVKIDVIYDPAGWADYSTEDIDVSRETIGSKVITASQDLASMAKGDYNLDRAGYHLTTKTRRPAP